MSVKAFRNYILHVDTAHRTTVIAVANAIDGRDHEQFGIPHEWSLRECTAGCSPWLVFECDEPFNEEDVQRVVRNMQLMDDAVSSLERKR
jgi:hypothetical protein